MSAGNMPSVTCLSFFDFLACESDSQQLREDVRSFAADWVESLGYYAE